MQHFRLSTTHVKFHQICTLIGSFCWNYIKFQLKKYRGVMSHDAEEGCKIWRKTDLLFQNDKSLVNFEPSPQKSQKFPLWLIPFMQSKWWKIQEELLCRFKIDMKNLTNFDWRTRKSQKSVLWCAAFDQTIKCLS